MSYHDVNGVMFNMFSFADSPSGDNSPKSRDLI
jgi:hypothetical protein